MKLELKVGDKFINGTNTLVTIEKICAAMATHLYSDFAPGSEAYKYYYLSDGSCPGAPEEFRFKCFPTKLHWLFLLKEHNG